MSWTTMSWATFKRRRAGLVVLLGAAIWILAACSGTSSPPSTPTPIPTTEPAAEATTAPAPEATPTEAESSQEPALPTLEPTAPPEEPSAQPGAGETPSVLTEELTIWVANGMENDLSVVNLATGQELARIPVGINPHILDASPDGGLLYVINAGGHDRAPAASQGQGNGSEGMGQADDAQKTPHGQGDGSGMGEGDGMGEGAGMDMGAKANSLWAIDTATGQVIAQVTVGRGPTHPIPSPDGRRVYVTNTDEGSVSVIDTATWEVIATIPDLPEPHDGELTPDGRLLYLATSGDSTMTVVDTENLSVAQTFPVGKKPRGVAVGGENGALAYVTNKGDGTLSIIDVPQGQVRVTAPVGPGAHALRVSQDGDTVYVALSKADAVAVVDASTGEVRQTVAVGAKPEQLDLSPDGLWLVASNNGDATISVIDLSRNEVVRTIPVGQGAYGVEIVAVPFQGTVATGLPTFSPNVDGFMDISVDTLAQALPMKNFTMVNVHIPYEGELPQTDLFIPFNEIVDNLDKLPSKEAPILVYCRSGAMSTVAAKALAQAGYTQVYELDGGFNAWKAAGHELITR